MKIIEPSYEILTPITGQELRMIEIAGRTCYKTEDKMTMDSANRFVKMLIDRGHEAMLEHGTLTVRFVCDRGVTHEIVRHRVASYAMESTKINYAKVEKGGELTFIRPFFFKEGSDKYDTWYANMYMAEKRYMELMEYGANPLEARAVLPHSVKAELVMTANYREWRHFLNLRAARATGPAHPQMEQLMVPLLMELATKIPVIFDDIAKRACRWIDKEDNKQFQDKIVFLPAEY